jgi:hypothetical protein
LALWYEIETYYVIADVDTKKRILSSILKEKLILKNNKVQTPILNDTVKKIVSIIKPFGQFKTGQTLSKKDLSRQVEQVGVEPTSGQVNDKLSTCVVTY